ncbi:MAG TPA: hypothetical protein VFO19_22355 [Vicinamibacterales bacterium]|nr:hypothetical protein [Vicinamibacterales bacterium]
MDLGVFLWTCTVLLIARVIGQLVVAIAAPRWLPPMEAWQSGLVPYPALVAAQAMVVTLMVSISIDVSAGRGFWSEPMPRLGGVVLAWSALYFGAMIVRYARRMIRRPDQRWLGGTIPIVFHAVIAAFQFAFACYHVAAR